MIVGTVLSAANLGSVIAAGDSNWVTWVRVGVNYATPFAVVSIGYLAGCRVRRKVSDNDDEGQL